MGQSVIVDNKPDARGLIAADILAKAPPHADVKRRFADPGVSVGSGSPEQLDTPIKSDAVKRGKAIRDAGIKQVD